MITYQIDWTQPKLIFKIRNLQIKKIYKTQFSISLMKLKKKTQDKLSKSIKSTNQVMRPR